MNIVLDSKIFNSINIFFLDKKKNNVIDGYFSKIIYSSDLFIMNGLSLLIPFVFDKHLSINRSDIYTKYTNQIGPDVVYDNRTRMEPETARESSLGCRILPVDSLSSTDNRYNVYYYTHHLINLQYISILTDIETSIINTYKEIYVFERLIDKYFPKIYKKMPT